MIRGAKVAVVVPAYQEAKHIGAVVSSIPLFVDEIVVVDDASNDETSARARGACTHAQLVVVTQERNTGVGRAIVNGYKQAIRNGSDVIAVMAGDGQMDPDDLRAVLEPVVAGEADYVKGNRLAHVDVWKTMPKRRLLGSLVLSRMTAWAVGQPIHDSQCGYTAVSAKAVQMLQLENLWAGYGYPNDLIGAMVLAGQRVAEVTVRPIYADEQSGMRPRHVVLISGLIARVAARRLGQWTRQRVAPYFSADRRTL